MFECACVCVFECLQTKAYVSTHLNLVSVLLLKLFLAVPSQLLSSKYQYGKYKWTSFVLRDKQKDWVFQKDQYELNFEILTPL